MTSLEDKAEGSDEVKLARQSAPGMYRLETRELVPADEIGDEFPQYGDFLRVTTTHGGEEPEWDEQVYIECPQALAEWLVEHDVDEGDAFRIVTVRKVDGTWQYEVEQPDLPDSLNE